MPSVLITGTSSGFGLVTAVELARRGWDVVATMRNLERRGALDDALSQAGLASRVRLLALDVTRVDSIHDAVAEILAGFGGLLDAVVHNAGVAAAGAFEDVPEEEARRVMETNFWGVLALTRELLPTFRRQRRGRMVVVSSNSAYAGEPANSIYVASKWAIEGWAESLAFEVAPFGIDISLIEPGPYRTEIWSSTPRILPEGSAYRPYLEQLERAIDERVLKDARDPREVAEVIAACLAADRPRVRYPVSPQAHVGHFLRGKVPTRLQRWLVTRLLGLDKVRLV